MPALVAWLVAGIGQALAGWFARLLFSFGMAVVVTTVALPPLRSYIQGMMAGLPADVLNMAAYMGIDRGITLILSALVTASASRMAIRSKSGA